MVQVWIDSLWRPLTSEPGHEGRTWGFYSHVAFAHQLPLRRPSSGLTIPSSSKAPTPQKEEVVPAPPETPWPEHVPGVLPAGKMNANLRRVWPRQRMEGAAPHASATLGSGLEEEARPRPRVGLTTAALHVPARSGAPDPGWAPQA